MDSVPVGLLVINPQGEIVTTNPAASEILGYPLDVLKGKSWGELFIHEERNVEFNQMILDVIWDKTVNLHRDVSYSRPTGEILKLSVTTSFLTQTGETVGIVVLLDDMTEIHDIREREKATLKEKHRIQSERAESLKNFALAVAHQIRNPITSIGGFAMRTRKKIDNENPSAVYLDNILSETKRLEDIVRAVKEYADLSTVVPEWVRISRVLEDARAGLDQRADQLSRNVIWNIQTQPVDVFIDPGFFLEALNEILLNALESFRGDQGSIDIVVHQDSKGLYITISDNGEGITEREKPYIFDPFFSTKAVGVGMGLCKAQRIIAEHNGDIAVDSRAHDGTTVTIRLPTRRLSEETA